MDNKISAKQQIIDKIKNSANILVTVSNDPSVDALSAALGLAVAIDKLDKHATAVFSGQVPPAITFLQPEKTFESTTDGLRDFIIALDKEKADHLRYKVEGDVVKIFITPYRTTITSDDLDFSQGDYNVELVLALGVNDQDHLDAALDAHGRILHDATVVTMTAGSDISELGGIDWHDDAASSLSEMVTGLIDGLKTDKTKPLLDQQIATALLTGIVAETDRFSNAKTTSQVMTISAQLMGAGADQQLVATKLQEEHVVNTLTPPETTAADIPVDTGSAPSDKTRLSITHDGTAEVEATSPAGTPITEAALPELPQAMPSETLEQLDHRIKAEHEAEAVDVAAEALKEELSTQSVVPTSSAPVIDLPPAPEVTPIQTSDMIGPAQVQEAPMNEPSFGGTLNATAEQAAEDSREALEDDRNKTTLNHAPYLSEQSGSVTPPAGEVLQSELEPEQPNLAELQQAATLNPVYAPDGAQPPSVTPSSLGLPLPPPLPDFSNIQTPDVHSAYAPEANPPLVAPPITPAPESGRIGDILPPAVSPAPTPPPDASVPGPDPGQFQIPGAPEQQ